MSNNSRNNNKSTDNSERKGSTAIGDYSKVVIIGGGISGLQCAQRLLERINNNNNDNNNKSENKNTKKDVVILEARNRIGGRIHTVKHKIRISQGDDGTEICVDEGAAWIHGTGNSGDAFKDEIINETPLVETCTMSNHMEEKKELDEEEEHRNPVVDLVLGGGGRLVNVSPLGNPWTRPRCVLHSVDLAATNNNDCCNNLVSFFMKESNSEMICRPTKHQIEQALQLHEVMLNQISHFGNAAFDIGEGLATTMISVADVLHLIGNSEENLDEQSASITNSDLDMASSNQLIRQTMNMIHDKYLLQYNNKNEVNNPTFNKKCKIIQSIANLYFYLWEIWQSASLHELPLSDYIQDDDCDNDMGDQTSGDFIGPHCTVANGGMSTALIPLLSYNGVKDCIQYNQEVTSITKQNNNIITITCKSGYIIHCNTCIITIPLSCLQENISSENIFFKPDISQSKIEAIQSLKMGHYKKVFLTFKTIFWHDKQSFIALIRSKNESNCTNSNNQKIDLGEYLWLDNLWAKDGIPCLEAILVGKAAQSCYNVPTHIIRDAILDFIQEAMISSSSNNQNDHNNSIHNNSINVHDLCISSNVTRWEEDIYSKGAYSYAPIGSKIRHFDSLQESEWDNTLYFAGECTMYEYQGSVHSALLSGYNVANKIII